MVVAIASLHFVAPASAVFLVLYLVLPGDWRRLRWAWTTLRVAAAAGMVTADLARADNPPESVFSWYLVAAAIGGTTCFVAAVTHERFSRDGAA